MAGHDGCREDETARMATERLRQPRQLHYREAETVRVRVSDWDT